MSPTIDIAVEDDAWTVIGDLDDLARRAVAAALATSGATIQSGAELSIVLGDDAFIRELNKTWRGKDKATNVLSFPTTQDTAVALAPETMLGDIVVAYETCAREAVAEGSSIADHLSHLIVHGFLHLLGFDHEDDAEAETMETLETRALKTLGIASPYPAAEETQSPP